MTEENKDKKIEDSTLREFSENPFDVDSRRPEDVVRLFYIHDVPIIPVISKRGVLIGILRKESVISELSDIERVEKLKIDEFITRLAVKMNFDDLLQYGKIREFVVINIFGEVQGTWSRLQLFASCDSGKISSHDEVKKQQEDQLLEWMIYHILEHIPRALYALNENGKTVFYNSLFEEIYEEKLKSEVDLSHAEKLFTGPSINELFSSFNFVNQGDKNQCGTFRLKCSSDFLVSFFLDFSKIEIRLSFLMSIAKPSNFKISSTAF